MIFGVTSAHPTANMLRAALPAVLVAVVPAMSDVDPANANVAICLHIRLIDLNATRGIAHVDGRNASCIEGAKEPGFLRRAFRARNTAIDR